MSSSSGLVKSKSSLASGWAFSNRSMTLLNLDFFPSALNLLSLWLPFWFYGKIC